MIERMKNCTKIFIFFFNARNVMINIIRKLCRFFFSFFNRRHKKHKDVKSANIYKFTAILLAQKIYRWCNDQNKPWNPCHLLRCECRSCLWFRLRFSWVRLAMHSFQRRSYRYTGKRKDGARRFLVADMFLLEILH